MADQELTADPPEAMVWEIANAIKAVFDAAFASIPMQGRVYAAPQYPSGKEEFKQIVQVDDPVMGANRSITNIIEIGSPIDPETEEVSTSDDCTLLEFNFPIEYTLGVVRDWDKVGFPYRNSTQLFMGVFMRARRLFKQDRTLGFKHVTHFYLQGDGYDEITDLKGQATDHIGDWTLKVHVDGKY